MFTITDRVDRGKRAKRRFYETLVRLLEEGPGVRPANVFVMISATPPENFSFADGVIGTDIAYAITELLGHRDSSRESSKQPAKRW